jgi:hypothetical protein
MASNDPRGTAAAIRNVRKWADRPEWAELYEQVLAQHIGETLKEFDLESVDALIEEIGELAFTTSVYGPAFEDFLTRSNDDGERIVDEYLRRRGYKESVPGRRYLEALAGSVMSLYEVIEAVPDSHMVLRDLVRGGEPVRVEERSGSRQAVKWDIVGARVLPHNRQLVLSGVILPLEPKRAEALLTALRGGAQEMQRSVEQKIIEAASKPSVEQPDAESEEAAFERSLRTVIRERAGSDDPDAIKRNVDGKFGALSMNLMLYHTAPFFTQVWLAQTLDRLQAPLPDLVNYDGEPIVYTETHWPLAADADVVAQRLDGAAAQRILRGDPEELHWNWQGEKTLSGGPRSAVADQNPSAADEVPDLMSLGSVAIEEGSLVLRTNSEARAARGRALLEGMLAGLLGEATVDRHDVVAEAWAGRKREADEAEMQAPEIPLDVKARLLADFKERHYRKWIDTTLPALDGKTPRQAAQTEADRAKLVRLLKDVENHELRSTRAEQVPAYDLSWLWRELGLQADAA